MLNTDRALSEKTAPHAPEFAHNVADGFQIYRGALVAVCEDGTIVPAGVTNAPSPLVSIVGIASRRSEGSEIISVRKGCYALSFDTAPGWASVGQDVYAVDDETVSLSNGASPSGDPQTHNPATRLKVGILAGIEAGIAYVLIS